MNAEVSNSGATPSQGSGMLARCYRHSLEEMGILQEIIRLAPTTEAWLKSPPMPLSWVGIEWFSHVIDTVNIVRGRDGCVQLGQSIGKHATGSVLGPVIRVLLNLSGSAPSALYLRLHDIVRPMLRNFGYRYVNTGQTSGIAEFNHGIPMTDSWFASWEGCLRYAFDLCSTKGVVGRAQIQDGGRAAKITVRW
jgi:hypothetical protein